MVDALAGDTQHRVAVVEFDSRPRMLQDFTSDPNAMRQAIYGIQPGDDGAAILDSVWYAVDMLRDEPPQNQRVIVLLSETRDSGSVTPMKEVIRKIGESDVIVYSLAFSPGREDALQFSPPAGSGFQILPALMMAIAALKKNSAAAIPHMTGGQYLRFNSGKQLDSQIGMLANQVHNRYMITFQPSDQHAGNACAGCEAATAFGGESAGTDKLLGDRPGSGGTGPTCARSPLKLSRYFF